MRSVPMLKGDSLEDKITCRFDPDLALPPTMKVKSGLFSEIAYIDPRFENMESISIFRSSREECMPAERIYQKSYGGDETFSRIYQKVNTIQFPEALDILHGILNMIVIGKSGEIDMPPHVKRHEDEAKQKWNKLYALLFPEGASIEEGQKHYLNMTKTVRGNYWGLSNLGQLMLRLIVTSKYERNEKVKDSYEKGIAAAYYMFIFGDYAFSEPHIAVKLIPHIFEHPPYQLNKT